MESEDQAKALIAQIKGGASFEELAKKNSKDPGSGANGGDLDFAKADSYVPEFGQALTQLKKGEMTQVPVKTQFGWHIIKLEDTREAEFPAFDDVKAQIIQRLEQIKLQQYQGRPAQGREDRLQVRAAVTGFNDGRQTSRSLTRRPASMPSWRWQRAAMAVS